jgi:decaprenyl-phosphate phosphoribosyltransferase
VTSTSADHHAVPIPGGPGSTGEERGGGRLQVLAAAPPSQLLGLLRTARPRQWVKNLLVFAAPAMAGLLTDIDAVLLATGAFGVFCLAATGTYFLNDALDVDADRRHPRKCRRPVATGTVSVVLAEVVGGALLTAAVALALVVAGWRLALVVAAYVALQPLYSVWLRNVPVVDLLVVAAGFVLRAIAGAVAVGVPISHWFLIVTSFGSLVLVSGKRTAEHIDLGEARASHRATLGNYSLGFLHHVRSASTAVAVAAYCLWAFERADTAPFPIWFHLSILPFVLVNLRYVVLLDAGRGGSPEELVLEDRALQVLGLLWAASVAAGIHGG